MADAQEEVEHVGPLLTDRMSPLCLKAEYVGNVNANFMHGIESLNARYEALRRVRGDGNCFFRGFIFALCERLLPSDSGAKTPTRSCADASSTRSSRARASSWPSATATWPSTPSGRRSWTTWPPWRRARTPSWCRTSRRRGRVRVPRLVHAPAHGGLHEAARRDLPALHRRALPGQTVAQSLRRRGERG